MRWLRGRHASAVSSGSVRRRRRAACSQTRWTLIASLAAGRTSPDRPLRRSDPFRQAARAEPKKQGQSSTAALDSVAFRAERDELVIDVWTVQGREDVRAREQAKQPTPLSGPRQGASGEGYSSSSACTQSTQIEFVNVSVPLSAATTAGRGMSHTSSMRTRVHRVAEKWFDLPSLDLARQCENGWPERQPAAA